MNSARWTSLIAAATLSLACGASPSAKPGDATSGSPNEVDASASLSPAEIARRTLPAIVSLEGPSSQGTGFVVRADGWVATSYHVAAGQDSLVATFADGRSLPVVEVLGVSRELDIVVLRVDASDLPVVTLSADDEVAPGDPVVAIGHPLGFRDTVSNGLVAGVRDAGVFGDLLQITAPISPGSSGGPILNEHGEVIAVTRSMMPDAQNVNFGVPVRYLRELLSSPEPRPMAPLPSDDAGLPSLPQVTRNVPEHPLSLLDGCGEGDLWLLRDELLYAISMGAPIYDQGEFAACAFLYEGAAVDVERRLAPLCRGPRRALLAGRQAASSKRDLAERAWALRDAFDGLIEVIERKLER